MALLRLFLFLLLVFIFLLSQDVDLTVFPVGAPEAALQCGVEAVGFWQVHGGTGPADAGEVAAAHLGRGGLGWRPWLRVFQKAETLVVVLWWCSVGFFSFPTPSSKDALCLLLMLLRVPLWLAPSPLYTPSSSTSESSHFLPTQSNDEGPLHVTRQGKNLQPPPSYTHPPARKMRC